MPDDWSHKAWMSVRDADMLERIVLRLVAVRPPPFRVLEWGSGKSTVYFSRMLESKNISCEWVAVEHDGPWVEKVRGDIPASAEVRHVTLGDAYPSEIEHMTPDLAIVDGRLRRRCLLAAATRAKVVILHDAQRDYYHSAFSAYKYQGRIGDMLWIGSQDYDLYEISHGRPGRLTT